MGNIGANLVAVRGRIERAERRFAREPGSVKLLAVSKAQGLERVRLAVATGQRLFGESYVQEALEKIKAIGHIGLEWHFIGALQSNKTRAVAEHFDWVHGVERDSLARRLNDQRPETAPPLNVCLQVNVSGEASKAGVHPTAVAALAAAVAPLPRLRLRGLMTLPAPSEEFDRQRAAFRVVRELFDGLRTDGYALDTLSMGMSDDLEAAIAEGATLVRVGSAIFGARGG